MSSLRQKNKRILVRFISCHYNSPWLSLHPLIHLIFFFVLFQVMLTTDCRVVIVRSEPDMIGWFKEIFPVWINFYLSLRINISILFFQLFWIGPYLKFLNHFAFSAALLICYPLLQRGLIILPLYNAVCREVWPSTISFVSLFDKTRFLRYPLG